MILPASVERQQISFLKYSHFIEVNYLWIPFVITFISCMIKFSHLINIAMGGGGGVRISNAIARLWVSVLCLFFYELSGAYHLTEKSGRGVESIMVSDLPVYRRNATSVTV